MCCKQAAAALSISNAFHLELLLLKNNGEEEEETDSV